MVEGVLTINLEPPYISFHSSQAELGCSRSCTQEEIRDILSDMDARQWPLKDCLIRLSTNFSEARLASLRLSSRYY